jgi:hypothetical protein
MVVRDDGKRWYSKRWYLRSKQEMVVRDGSKRW